MRKILIILLCCITLPLSSADAKGLGYYGKADDFTLMSVNDEEITISSEARTKQYTLLVFLRFDDPACRIEASRIAKFYSNNGALVKVLGIDIMENKAIAKEYADKLGLNFPVMLDLNGAVANLYAIRGLPTLILLDRDMEILYAAHEIFKIEKTLESKGIR